MSKFFTWFDEIAKYMREDYMMRWKCSFCGKHEESGMVHTTCIKPTEHFFFCRSCNAQWEGNAEMTNVGLIKLKMEIRDAKTEEEVLT